MPQVWGYGSFGSRYRRSRVDWYGRVGWQRRYSWHGGIGRYGRVGRHWSRNYGGCGRNCWLRCGSQDGNVLRLDIHVDRSMRISDRELYRVGPRIKRTSECERRGFSRRQVGDDVHQFGRTPPSTDISSCAISSSKTWSFFTSSIKSTCPSSNAFMLTTSIEYEAGTGVGIGVSVGVAVGSCSGSGVSVGVGDGVVVGRGVT